MVPVGDLLKPKAALLREGLSNEEIRDAYQALNVIDAAIQSGADKAILKRCRSPREVFESLEKWHDPESEMATQRLYNKFHEFAIPPHSNPIAALHDLKDINNQMYEKGIGWIPTPQIFGFTHLEPCRKDALECSWLRVQGAHCLPQCSKESLNKFIKGNPREKRGEGEEERRSRGVKERASTSKFSA